MTAMLAWCGARARWFLIGGLLVGAFARPVAEAFLPLVGPAIALLLFLACYRTGLRAAAGSKIALIRTLLTVLLLQIAVPLTFIALGLAAGIPDAALGPPILLLAASSVTVVPHYLAILGLDSAPAVRLLLAGTLLVPSTAWLVFTTASWSGIPFFGDPTLIAISVARLLVVVTLAAGAAFALRRWVVPIAGSRASDLAEGMAAIALSVVVIGLMAPLGAAWAASPAQVLGALFFAFAINWALQLGGWFAGGLVARSHAERVAIATVNGNRNFALFLTALPFSVVEPMLLFIACYQVPNYLTPFIFRRLYAPKEPATS